MNFFTLGRVPTIAAAMILSLAVARSASFDPAVDFSLAGNPNGPWSYGYSQLLGGPLILHVASGSGGGLDYWNTDISIGLPWIVRNSTATAVNWAGTTVFAPGALSLHPGPQGEVEVLRFTVPSAGQYLVSGAFFGLDYVGPTTTDVHILLNGSSIFDDVVSDYGSNHPFSTTLTLTAGSQLDFAVSFGSNQTYLYDSTGLTATITQVPEPATLALCGLAAGLLFRVQRREHPAVTAVRD
jgi:hypothetical protein